MNQHTSGTAVTVGDYRTTMFLRKREWQYTKSSTNPFLVGKTSHTLVMDKFSTDNMSLCAAFDRLILLNWEFYLWFQRNFTDCSCFYGHFPAPGKVHEEPKAKEELHSERPIKLQKTACFENYSYWKSSLQESTDTVFFSLVNYQPTPPTVTADLLPHSRIFNRA